jgi:hypothetical protein
MTTPTGTWTYTGPSASDKDEVRFLIQDTDPALPLLADDEITYLIDKWQQKFDSNIAVAAVAAGVISWKFAVVPVSADGVTVNLADLSKKYADMAMQLRQEYMREQSTGLVDISNLMINATLDPEIAPLNFSIGMHDNPEAGEQAFGGVVPLTWPEHQ